MATISEALWAKEGMEVTVMVNHPFVNLKQLTEDKLPNIELISASYPDDRHKLYKASVADLIAGVVKFPITYSERDYTLIRVQEGYDYIVKIKDLEIYIKG